MKQGTPIQVTWKDAYCHQGWHDNTKVKHIIVETLGFFGGYEDGYIKVTQARDNNNSLDNTTFIPKAMISKIKKLK